MLSEIWRSIYYKPIDQNETTAGLPLGKLFDASDVPEFSVPGIDI